MLTLTCKIFMHSINIQSLIYKTKKPTHSNTNDSNGSCIGRTPLMKHTAMRKQLRMSTYSRYLLLNAIQKRLVIHLGTAKCSIQVANRAVSWRKRGFREAKSYFIYTLCTTSTCPTGSAQLFQRTTVITSKDHSRFSPWRARDIILLISELVMSQLEKVHSISSSVF